MSSIKEILTRFTWSNIRYCLVFDKNILNCRKMIIVLLHPVKKTTKNSTTIIS